MTTEEKVKAYDEAFERYKAKQEYASKDVREFMESIFPELAESKDERIRKRLLKLFKEHHTEEWYGLNVKDVITWLEKHKDINEQILVLKDQIESLEAALRIERQGKQKSNECSSEDAKIRRCLLSHFSRYQPEEVYINDITIKDIVTWLEKQKPVEWSEEDIILIDKVCDYLEKYAKIVIGDYSKTNILSTIERLKSLRPATEEEIPHKPKFKVGDWIISKHLFKDEHLLRQVLQVSDYSYNTDHGAFPIEDYDNTFRRWTIQDAKNGDILVAEDYILIFKKLLFGNVGESYCHYNKDHNIFDYNEDDNWYFGKETEIYPATQSQKEILFKAMKEAGYEWDAEKKILINLK